MIKCIRFIIAENIIYDNLTSKMSAINLLEDATLNTIPATIPLSGYFIFERDKAKDEMHLICKLTIELNSKVLKEVPFNLDLTKGVNLSRNVVHIGSIVLSEAGNFTFKVIDDKGKLIKERNYRMTSVSS
jgi:hypothetical protein